MYTDVLMYYNMSYPKILKPNNGHVLRYLTVRDLNNKQKKKQL